MRFLETNHLKVLQGALGGRRWRGRQEQAEGIPDQSPPPWLDCYGEVTCQLSFKLGLRLRRKVTKKIRKQQIVLPLDIVDWILLTYRVYNDYSSLRRKLIYLLQSHTLNNTPGLKDFQQNENN